jgi:hypothetical protein
MDLRHVSFGLRIVHSEKNRTLFEPWDDLEARPSRMSSVLGWNAAPRTPRVTPWIPGRARSIFNQQPRHALVVDSLHFSLQDEVQPKILGDLGERFDIFREA